MRLQTFYTIAVSLLVPVVLLGTGLRLLLLPAFLEMEYRMPGFPADPYGFSQADRLRYGKETVSFLTSNQTIDFFVNKHLPNGRPLYNNRELAHMSDVKQIITLSLHLWLLALFALLVLLGVGLKMAPLERYLAALTRGAWLTIALVSTLILVSVVAFGIFFDYFHKVLFTPGTWTFLESDTFIRLFPERFWQDAFLWGGALVLFQAIGILLVASRIRKLLFLNQ